MVSHLFGSLHYGVGVDELPPSTIASFTASQAHVYELNVVKEWDILRRVGHEPALMPELLRLAGRDTLMTRDFSEAEVSQLVTLVIPRHVALWMRDEQCQPFVYRALLFGSSPARSLDAEFQAETLRLGRRFIELENDQIRDQAREQATAQGYDDTCSIRAYLRDPNKRMADDQAVLDMIAQYRSLSPRNVLVLGDDDDPDVGIRNRVWMKSLLPLMKSTPSFVVVGVLHLSGPHGLIALLRESGFTVEAE